MSDEELEQVMSQAELLLQNGFAIDDPRSFISFGDDADLRKTIESLKELQEESTKPVNLEYFNRSMLENLKKMEDILGGLSYNVHSADFSEAFEAVKSSFSSGKKYYKAVEVAKARKEVVADINNRIGKISLDNSIDDITRTQETFRYKAGLEKAKQDAEAAEKDLKEQEALYQESLECTDIVAYKNGLLKTINALDDSCRRSDSLPFDVKDKLAEVIREMRDSVVVLDLARQQKETEFKEMLRKNNLKYDASIVEKYNALKEQMKEEEKVVEEDRGSSKPKENVPQKEEIVTVESLAIALRELNPDVIIETLDGLGVGHTIADYTIAASVSVEKLKLPEGFYLDSNNCISNRQTTKSPRGEYIAVEVWSLDRKKTYEQMRSGKRREEAPEEELEASAVKANDPAEFDMGEEPKQGEPAINEGLKKSSVPSGKQKVTKIRRANVAPFVQNALALGAIGFALTFTATASLVPAGIFAAVGAVSQALYRKLAVDGRIDPQFEGAKFAENPEDAPAILGCSKMLLNFFRDIRRKKQSAKFEPIEEEKVEEPIAPVVTGGVGAIDVDGFAKKIEEGLEDQLTPTGGDSYGEGLARTFDEGYSGELNLGDNLEQDFSFGGR